MRYCKHCKRDVHPVKTMGETGEFFDKCTCNAPLDRIEPRVMSGDEIVAVKPAEHETALLAPSPVRAQLAPTTSAATSTQVLAESGDFLEAAKARLAVVDQLIAELRKFESEQRKLRAMITAAEATE